MPGASGGSSIIWDWDWRDMCGPKGLETWDPETKDLGLCFQRICLQLPIFVLVSIVSAYFFGRQANWVVRDKIQILSINARCIVVLFLSIFPILRLYFHMNTGTKILPVAVLINVCECITWVVHLGACWALKGRGGTSSRGPLTLRVLWTVVYVLNIVWLRSNIGLDDFGWALTSIVLNTLYGFTMILGGHSRSLFPNQQVDESERRPLLGAYSGFREENDPHALGRAAEGAPTLSKALLYWVGALIQKGVNGNLKETDDLFDLPNDICCEVIADNMEEKLRTSKSLLRSLHSLFGVQFYSIGIIRLIGDLSGFAGPLLLGGLIGATNNDPSSANPFIYASGLLGTAILAAFCTAHFNFLMSVVGLRMRAAIITTVYRKILGAKDGSLGTGGQALNYMSTDTERIVNSCSSFHAFWSIPFQLFTTLYLLYTQLGLAFLGGVGVAVALIPINKYIAGMIGSLSTGLLQGKDARVGATGEMLRGIRSVKLFAWEEAFTLKIEKLRGTEVSYLRKRKYLDALCVFFWACTPVLMSVITFSLYSALGNTLVARSVFTSTALLAMLIGPLNAFPWVLNGLVEAWVSLKRIQKLIDTPDLNLLDYYKVKESSNNAIGIQGASFTFPIDANGEESTTAFNSPGILSIEADGNLIEHREFALKKINLQIKKGELVGIIGPVGAGKSALLSAILASMKKQEGDIFVTNVDNGFGYVSQTIWLQRGTIRENILFGRGYEEARYKAVINACALAGDLEILGGDQVGVGEGGATLSGGQKARVALARAVYQDKSIYLFDDILCSLDGSVASHIARRCILELLRHKTRIIITSHRGLLFNCDVIIQMSEGSIHKIGSPTDVLGDPEDISDTDCDIPRALSNLSLRQYSINSYEEDSKSVDSVLEDETIESGSLQANVLFGYWRAAGALLGSIVLISVVLMQASRNISDAWLAHWVTQDGNTNSTNVTYFNPVENNSFVRIEDTTTSIPLVNASVRPHIEDEFGADSIISKIIHIPSLLTLSTEDTNNSTGVSFYLQIYAGLAILNAIFTFARAFLFAYAGIKAAKMIHDKLLGSIISAQISFFDITPLGRILNRFSSDTYTIDDSLPFILNILLAQLAGLIGSLSISLYAMPWLGLLVAPLIPLYHALQGKYRSASREIKRLSSRAMSPLYNLFTETIQGLSTIRAFRAGPRFRRDFMTRLEDSLRTQLCNAAASQWLGLRLQLLGAVLIGGAGFLAALQTNWGTAEPALVGLAISYALSLTGLLSGLVNAFSETEQELVAVERVLQYSEAPSEPKDGVINAPYGWPSQGIVKFNNVSLNYREHLLPAITQVSFEIRGNERVGIVGRTGAGKSSILAALFRTAIISEGEVEIDHVSISQLPLKTLRSRITIVPQDPFLFSGTLRDNLDPKGRHNDTDIWTALSRCHAATLARNIGGLEASISTGGANISAGQRQLLCLTRAVLRNAKVVCIDEATANIDPETDILIQRTLKSAFRNSTVIIIAHRIGGLRDANRIIVMDKGRVVENGEPVELLADSQSIFKKMMDEEIGNSDG